VKNARDVSEWSQGQDSAAAIAFDHPRNGYDSSSSNVDYRGFVVKSPSKYSLNLSGVLVTNARVSEYPLITGKPI
jgi:hypothetical protein